MFAYISKQYIKIYCAHDKNIQKIPITITKAIAQVTQKVQLIQQLINAAECNYISLNNAIHQNNRYFELDILEEVKNNKLICIKSSLGTGKSEQIKRYIEECKDNILIVSHRLSYTANIKSRYPDFVDYSEQSGDLSL